MNKSPGYLNLALFIAYLFVAVFILLSMFFAILGEAQANVRDDERESRKKAKADATQPVPAYGILASAYEKARELAARMPMFGRSLKLSMREAKLEEIRQAVEDNGPTAVDRVEARQLEMLDQIKDLFAGVVGDRRPCPPLPP